MRGGIIRRIHPTYAKPALTNRGREPGHTKVRRQKERGREREREEGRKEGRKGGKEGRKQAHPSPPSHRSRRESESERERERESGRPCVRGCVGGCVGACSRETDACGFALLAFSFLLFPPPIPSAIVVTRRRRPLVRDCGIWGSLSPLPPASLRCWPKGLPRILGWCCARSR